ncbi:hypothetical protein Hypma_007110 [Hypsizygus marmoreus]|uniref:Uncharacterized protein n=1 Tax=Hypsizygus marmoreus TaxID=39966 RepID=A0A369K6P7_HYPMA|nr:hypothetical protein Hypma_007110 [Hypsizygus marmoreus]
MDFKGDEQPLDCDAKSVRLLILFQSNVQVQGMDGFRFFVSRRMRVSPLVKDTFIQNFSFTIVYGSLHDGNKASLYLSSPRISIRAENVDVAAPNHPGIAESVSYFVRRRRPSFLPKSRQTTAHTTMHP